MTNEQAVIFSPALGKVLNVIETFLGYVLYLVSLVSFFKSVK